MQVVKRTDLPFCYTSPGRTAVRGLSRRVAEGRPCGDADRDPRSRGSPVTSGFEQVARRLDRGVCVVRTGQRPEEQRDDRVAHEFVDHRVARHQHVCGHVIEAIEQTPEGVGTHGLGETRRPAHVGEQHAQLDLRAATSFLELLEAEPADARVLDPGSAVQQPRDRRAESSERGGAQLAARRARDHPEEAAPTDVEALRGVLGDHGTVTI